MLLRFAYILPLLYNHIVNPLASLKLINQLIPFPKCLQRACVLDTRSSPSPFPSSLVTNPTKETFEESSREVVVALDRVLSDEDAVPGQEVKWLALALTKPIWTCSYCSQCSFTQSSRSCVFGLYRRCRSRCTSRFSDSAR